LIRFASRHETGRNRPEQTSQLPLPRLPPRSAELQDSLDIGGVDAEVSDLVSIDNAALEAIYDDDAPRIRILSPPPQLPENGPLSSAQLVAIMEAALPQPLQQYALPGELPYFDKSGFAAGHDDVRARLRASKSAVVRVSAELICISA